MKQIGNVMKILICSPKLPTVQICYLIAAIFHKNQVMNFQQTLWLLITSDKIQKVQLV